MSLPFDVGTEAEARTFMKGYRGAWFRCKIRGISYRSGDIEYRLEYFDFPEEKLGGLKQYQFCVNGKGKLKKKERILMVRPPYPPIYRESEMPCLGNISGVVIIVNDDWKAGDLVDFWTCDCYWSARIKQLLADGKALIEYPEPPFGEGTADDEASLKDLRPTLGWTPEYGWIVPIPASETGLPCARIIKPGDQGLETEVDKVKAGLSSSLPPYSCISLKSLAASDELKDKETRELRELSSRNTVQMEAMDTEETIFALDGGVNTTQKTFLSDMDSSSYNGEILAEPTTNVTEQDSNYASGAQENSGGITLNSMRSNKLEATITDLEELVNKVKWLKSLLASSGGPSSDAALPQWKVEEKHHPSLSKAK